MFCYCCGGGGGGTRYEVLRGVREAEAGGYAEMRSLLALELGETVEQQEEQGRKLDRGREGAGAGGHRHKPRNFTHGGKLRVREGRGGGGVSGNTYAAQLSRQIQAHALTHPHPQSAKIRATMRATMRLSQSQDSLSSISSNSQHRRTRTSTKSGAYEHELDYNSNNGNNTALPLKQYVTGVVSHSRSNTELLGRSTSMFRDPGCV